MKLLLKISIFVFAVLFAISCNRTPEFPKAIYPLDSAKNITDKELRLSWYSFDKDGDKMYYDILFAEDTGFYLTEKDIIIKNFTENSYVIKYLKDSTSYIWGITVYDEKGNHCVGTFAFTTGIIKR